MSKQIPLGASGKSALVDEEDYGLLSEFNWKYFKKPSDKTGYAFRAIRIGYGRGAPQKRIWMHRVIAGFERPDHINGNGIDNRKSNLRKATKSQQAYNRGVHCHKKSSGGKGVSWVRDRAGNVKWCIARITVEGKRIYLGIFENENLATDAYNKAAKKYHKDFARTL